MKRATVLDLGGGILLKTPFLEEFVDALKSEIPARKRRWDPDRKAWWVAASAANRAIAIAHRYYLVERSNDDNNPAAASDSPETAMAWKQLWLVPGAPPEVIEAAYGAMAKLHHPDYGGDSQTMQRVNWAYEVLEAKR